MRFKDLIADMSEELGAEIDIESDACAVAMETKDGVEVTIVMQGFDERGVVFSAPDLGEPPPEGREQLFQTLLTANDVFEGTGGATLSINPATWRVRLQRHDAIDALAEAGAAKAFVAFANVAAAWKKTVADFRASVQRPSASAGGGETFRKGEAIFV